MGNSVPGGVPMSSKTVHPHVHGELRFILISPVARGGSSPRAWGTLDTFPPSVQESRFIPTCMGNSATVTGEYYTYPVHPHVHGELTFRYCIAVIYRGSSPRAWGTLRDQRAGSQQFRFIPTCMGNSPSHTAVSTRLSVHPHVHGELGLP